MLTASGREPGHQLASNLRQSLKLVDQALFGGAGADDFVFFLTAFKEQQQWNRANAVFNSECLGFVDIDFSDLDGVAEFFSDFVEHRGDHFAGATPLCPEIDENRDFGLFDFSGEVVFGEINDGCVSHEKL